VTFRSLADLPGMPGLAAAARPGACSTNVWSVDNASDDGTVAWLRFDPSGAASPGERRKRRLRARASIAGRRRQARGRISCLLNPDATPAPGSLAALVARLEGDPSSVGPLPA
jgi:GT2 family glycosyltransferase